MVCGRFILALMLLSGTAYCGSLDVTIASSHFNSEPSLHNEHNLGLGITTEYLTFGFYENSFYNASVYLMGNLEAKKPRWSLGLLVGVVTGYEEKTNNKLQPMLLPYFTFGSSDYRARIGVLPSVITFQFQFLDVF